MLRLLRDRHPAEDHFLAGFTSAGANQGGIIEQARAAGVPWATLFEMLAKFGPMFVAALKALLDALHTPPLPPPPPATSGS